MNRSAFQSIPASTGGSPALGGWKPGLFLAIGLLLGQSLCLASGSPPAESRSRGATTEISTEVSEAQTLLRAGRPQQALSLVSSIAARTDAPLEALIAFAWASLDSGDPAAAREAMERATEHSPESAPAWFFLGRAYGEEAKTANPLRGALLARKVEGAFERALALDPEFLEPRFGLIVFYATAPSMVGGDRDAAYEQARTVARADRHQGDRAWALVYELEESFDRAESIYRRMIERRPSDPDPYLRLVWLTQRQKRFPETVKVLDQMNEQLPENPNLLWEIGRTAAFSGLRLEAGIQALRQVLSDRELPTERQASARYHLATAYRHQGRDDLAIVELRQAVSLDAQHKAALASLRELEQFVGGGQ